MQLGEMTLEETAEIAKGNWRDFESFCWFREKDLADPENWCVVYTHHRDSGLLARSNAAAVEAELEEFTQGDDPDVAFERHDHFAFGHVDGMSIRVFKDGEITEAFQKYHELAERMADYPLLDEQDYSRREYEATLENLAEAASRLRHDYELPDDWQSEVYRWLWDHDQAAVESRDDRGGYPSESQLRAAFEALGYEELATA